MLDNSARVCCSTPTTEILYEPGAYWFWLTFQSQGRKWTELKNVTCCMVCTFSHQNHIGHCHLLQACSNINCVASNEEIMSPELSAGGGNLTRVYANAHLQPICFGVLRQPSLIEPGKRCLHVQGSSNGAIGIVLMSGGCSENCHHCITDIFLDGAAVTAYLLGHQVKIARQNGPQIFRIKFIGKGRRPSDVSEHDGHDTPFLGCREPDFTAAIQVC